MDNLWKEVINKIRISIGRIRITMAIKNRRKP